MKAGGNRSKPGGGSGAGTTSGAGGSGGGRQSLGRGRHSGKGPSSVCFNGVYANMRMVHVLTSVVGTKCELKVKNGTVYEGVFKTYGPECDLVLDAAHRKSTEPNTGPRKEDIVESIIFKASDVVVVSFKDVDLNFARKDNFTDSAVSGRINGEHKEKDLEPWDGGETHHSDSLESLDTDVGSSRAGQLRGVFETGGSGRAQLAEEIEASATYKARVALENDERTEEDKYTAVVRGERDGHALSRRTPDPSSGPHDYSPSASSDQRVVNGGSSHWSSSPCPSPSRYPPGPSSLPPRATTPTRPPSRPPSRPSRPPSHSSHSSYPSSTSSSFSHHGPTSPASTLPKRMSSEAHRPRSPRQNNMSGASPGSSTLPSPQTGTVPIETTGTPSASSPTAASPAPNMIPSSDGKDCRVQETRQTSPTANKENIKPLESSPSISRPVCKGPPSMAPDHRKQIDNLKKFSVDFRLQPSSNPDPSFEQMMTKGPRDSVDKPKDLPLDKASAAGREASEDGVVVITPGTPGSSAAPSSTSNSSKPGSPAALSPSPSAPDLKRAGLDMSVQTTPTSAYSGAKHEDKEEKKEAVQDQVRKSTLNPNANEFKPRFNAQPKPANTPTPPRPQGQPSPSIVVPQPPTVYGQTVCFPQMYPLTPVSPGVQSPMYQLPISHMTVSQSKPYRPGKVPNMPQQRSEQHHAPGTPTMMHSATAAGPPIMATSPAYSAQYFTCSPQQFTSQPLVQQMPHYQSQAQHVFSPVMQGSARMMAPPTHGQPSSSQYPEQTHTMYDHNLNVVRSVRHVWTPPSFYFINETPVSPGPMPQQYTHHSATLHPHPQHPQPSATPTGQGQQGGPPQHTGPPNHPAASPVQHPQHPQAAAAAAALHLANQPQQQMYSALAPHPPSMTPRPKPSVPPGLVPLRPADRVPPPHTGAARLQPQPHGPRPAVHSSLVPRLPQAHMQSGIVPSHHPAPTHPPMMLMATQGPPGGPQPPMAQTALNPIPVSSTTHFSYLTHPVSSQLASWFDAATVIVQSSALDRIHLLECEVYVTNAVVPLCSATPSAAAVGRCQGSTGPALSGTSCPEPSSRGPLLFLIIRHASHLLPPPTPSPD
ncbi:hypothetical protein NQD34_007257 [Periophthalmus magnuspinnatus]|nr:hypothetical protein NQD34_007257 [Periophthalmus magnuspinnatus]